MKEKPLLYAALGDSITRGVGSLLAPGFVSIYANLTENSLRKKVKYRNIAKNGATTKDTLLSLKSESVKSLIRYSNLITITVGGNDLKNAGRIYLETANKNILISSLIQAQENMTAILDSILYLKSGNNFPFIIRIVNLYNPAPRVGFLSWWVLMYNSFLLTLQTDTIKIADIYSIFQNNLPRLLFFDNIHPNEKGYRVIAHQLYNTGYFPVSNKEGYPFLDNL